MNAPLVACLAVTTILFSISCTHQSVEDDFIPASNYYPFRTGNFIIYTVDSIQYHETQPTDTSHYVVKEMIADTFYDNENRLNYTIERYAKKNDTGSFFLQNIWAVLEVNGRIQKIEDNLRFIKLVSSVRQDETWEGHAYLGGLDDIPVPEECNNYSFLEDWVFEYSSVAEPFQINEFYFDNTVTVEETGSLNLLEYNYAKEIYAENIGLIYKEFYHYTDDDIDCPECSWLEHVECGYSVVMKVIEF
ncbi:MAG: hypothetical protein ACHQFW_11765 [Chitinophagales bacterium]